ncbi:MAG: metalloregulator ArsR/SmtB family transcription factor [Candidatus Gastranaerophilales bacterium]|nr:metalloregulator ArsR/SmtB family transcription factor [Candidatus Gastranaerophilales bacterium]
MNKEFYKMKTDIIKALANPIRLMIVDCLLSGEKSVSEIIQTTGEEQSNISKSLGILKAQGLIKDRKNGMNVYYSLKVCCMAEFFSCLNRIIQDNFKYQQELVNSSIKGE